MISSFSTSRLPRLFLLTSLSIGLLLGAAWTPPRYSLAHGQGLSALQYIEPFLYPPFPGTASEESVFDHSSPNYTSTDNRIITYGGEEALKNCPSSSPDGYPPPQAGVCDVGLGIYWSYVSGDWIAYNGHDGVDFGMQYRPILAAAETDQVVYAGWQDPRDHTYALGLHVKLHHPNGYITSYGHMSAVAVQSCPVPGCARFAHGEVIGYSGNTGNSAGPHLHFRVGTPSNKSIDPYGWNGEQADPWPYNQRNSLWVQYPSTVVYYGGRTLVYPLGEALPYPTIPPGGVVVDDGGPLFSQSPAGCFTTATTPPAQSEAGIMHYVRPDMNLATCTARWEFPPDLSAGIYQLYIRIPAAHATSEGARYTIAHSGQASLVTINQKAYPNPFFVTDGWVYIGKYQFSGGMDEYITLSNLTDDAPTAYPILELAVDAVRFVRVGKLPSTVTPSRTNTIGPSLTSTRTQTSTITLPPGLTSVETRTDTPTTPPSQTRTNTLSRTFTPSRTSSPSPSITSTLIPSPTRTPSGPFSACPGFLLIPIFSLLLRRAGRRVPRLHKYNPPHRGGQDGGPK